jgi:4-hydroxybenzoate polyprenyltransferase/phosphoserine phosphatase
MPEFTMEATQSEATQRPLVVDLDGTLLRSDLLFETVFNVLGRNPLSFAAIARAAFSGKAGLKQFLAANSDIKPELLPYDDVVLSRIRDAKAAGRKVYLASASNRRLVSAVADHLGIFDGTFFSDGKTNLAGPAKAQVLVDSFGERGFDYIGNGRADLPVWEKAAKRIAIGCPGSVARRLLKSGEDTELLSSSTTTNLNAWLRLLRIHQYSKNILLFVPLVTSQAFNLSAISIDVFAFIAFCLCASSFYIVNDIVDLAADRSHPTKWNRPLASGAIPIAQALLAATVLCLASAMVAAAISLTFFGVLMSYVVLTVTYTLYLKRKLLVDVIALASLYTIRVVAGAVAIDVFISQWLLGFSLFIFATLALVKRYTELSVRLDKNLENPTNRNYRVDDLSIIAALAAAAGLNSVTVFALYVSSDSVRELYRRPELLWLFCPVLMYWIGRTLILAHRRQMHDDPIVFALRDRVSYIALAVAGIIILVAKFGI